MTRRPRVARGAGATMRVVTADGDGPAGLHVVEVPRPEPAAGEVLVEVAATGLNRGELLRRSAHAAIDGSGLLRSGSEFAGRVVGRGAGVEDFEVGDRVMGRLPGANADYVVTRTDSIITVPGRLSDFEAAAIPIAYMTAHDALFTNAELRTGESVLVLGAAAGVGIAAAQLAHLRGANVVIGTTRRPDKVPRLLDAGFDAVVGEGELADAVAAATQGRGVDVVIDLIGASTLTERLESMAVGGRMVCVGRSRARETTLDLEVLAVRRLRLIGVSFRSRTPHEALACWQRFVADAAEPLETGRLRPVVDRVFPLDQLAAAEHYMLGDAHVGKIVLDLSIGR